MVAGLSGLYYLRNGDTYMIDKNAPVGVFDSGVGGLTVAREIMRNLPSEKIVYFGAINLSLFFLLKK